MLPRGSVFRFSITEKRVTQKEFCVTLKRLSYMRGGLQCPAGSPVVISRYRSALADFADEIVCKDT